MKTEKTIYIRYDNCLFLKNSFFIALIASGAIVATSFAFNYFQFFNQESFYFTLSVCLILLIIAVYHLFTQAPNQYISINDDEISFKQSKADEEICLKFEGLDYFETRFSEIIFSTKQQEKIRLSLKQIQNEKKRWEIKEFLRERVTQIKTNVIAA